MVKNQQAFTLLELCIAMAIASILLLSASMSVSYWNNNTDLMTAKASLTEGYMKMRAMALRNPVATSDSASATSTLSLNASTNTLVLCSGSTGCSTPTWSSLLPTGVQIAVGGEVLNCLAMNSSGQLVNGSNSCVTSGASYSITTKGVAVNGSF